MLQAELADPGSGLPVHLYSLYEGDPDPYTGCLRQLIPRLNLLHVVRAFHCTHSVYGQISGNRIKKKFGY